MRKILTILLVLLLTPVITPYKKLQAEEFVPNKAKVESEQVTEVITYNPEGRRDPFLSIIALTKQKVQKKKKRVNPLENYDVTDFRLLGVVFDGKDYYASVLLPDGKAYTIRKGMTLGLYGGKVIDIKSNSLTVREYVMDYKGRLKPKDIVLKLRKEEE